MASALTPDAIISQFENLIDDSLDQTTELFLLNQVKDEIELSRAWQWLKALDKSKTRATGDNWQTVIALPADFILPSPRGIYVGTDRQIFRQLPFEAQIDAQDLSYAYWLDPANGNYYISGTGFSGTINFFYQKSSPTLSLGGAAWIFPAVFHPQLPFKMAKKYFAIDQGSKVNAWDDRWDSFIADQEAVMNAWDDQLQMLALQNEQNMAVDFSANPTIIDGMMNSPGGASMFG